MYVCIEKVVQGCTHTERDTYTHREIERDTETKTERERLISLGNEVTRDFYFLHAFLFFFHFLKLKYS